MKYFLYITFLVLFSSVIGIAWYVFVQFDGLGQLTKQVASESVPLDSNEVTFVSQSEVTEGEYVVDPTQSMVTWTGSRPDIRNIQHRGTVAIANGAIVVAGASTTALIELAMQRVTVHEEYTPEHAAALHALVTGPLFFDSEHYPVSKVIVHRIEKIPEKTNIVTVSASLEMHGQARDIAFPATVYMKDENLKIVADLTLNRLDWGMTYNSESVLGKLAENAISDTVGISLDITATPKSE